MTENNKKEQKQGHKEIHKTPKKNGRYILVTLLIAAILGCGAYFIFNMNHFGFNEPKHIIQNNKENTELSNTKAQGDSTIQCKDEEIIKFGPEEVIEAFTADDSQELSPYDIQAEEEFDEPVNAMPDVSLINDLNDYRIYLANVTELLIRFYKNMDYSTNLAIIIQIDLPKEIKEIVAMLESYNNMLTSGSIDNGQVLLFNTDIFEKFLKIRKETPAQHEMKKLKTNIENEIGLFTEYIFSPELQEAFLK